MPYKILRLRDDEDLEMGDSDDYSLLFNSTKGVVVVRDNTNGTEIEFPLNTDMDIGAHNARHEPGGGDVVSGVAPGDHAVEHESGGGDIIDVGGLSGVLSDNQPSIPHDIGGGKHNSDTLTNLNSIISDATLDDSSSTRDPNTHDNTAHSSTYSTFSQSDHDTVIHNPKYFETKPTTNYRHSIAPGGTTNSTYTEIGYIQFTQPINAVKVNYTINYAVLSTDDGGAAYGKIYVGGNPVSGTEITHAGSSGSTNNTVNISNVGAGEKVSLYGKVEGATDDIMNGQLLETGYDTKEPIRDVTTG